MHGSRIFFRGGPHLTDVFLFFFVVVLVLNLFYSLQRGWVNSFYYRENYTSPRIQRESNIFQGGGGGGGGGGGVQLFPGGGSNVHFYRNPYMIFQGV